MRSLLFPSVRRLAGFIPVVALVTCPSLSNAVTSDEQLVTGRWKLTAALDGAEITSLDEREAQRLVGRVFTISRQHVKFGSRECGPSDFEAERVSPRLYLPEQFHANADKLHLPTPVTVVELSCTSVFIKCPNQLVIAWKGWFFDAVKLVDSKRTAQTKPAAANDNAGPGPALHPR